jgi:hypothetical protein
LFDVFQPAIFDMPSLAPGALGIIHMVRKPSRVDQFLEQDEHLDCAGELIRLSRSEKIADSPGEGADDEVVLADTEQLAKELNAEYAALCDTMDTLRR